MENMREKRLYEIIHKNNNEQICRQEITNNNRSNLPQMEEYKPLPISFVLRFLSHYMEFMEFDKFIK